MGIFEAPVRRKPMGQHEIKFNAANLPSGVYYYTLRAGSHSVTRKLFIMK
jgi:hypothetical protein